MLTFKCEKCASHSGVFCPHRCAECGATGATPGMVRLDSGKQAPPKREPCPFCGGSGRRDG